MLIIVIIMGLHDSLAHDLFLGVLIPNEMADNTTQETKDLPFAFFLEIQSKLGNQAWSSIIAGMGGYTRSHHI